MSANHILQNFLSAENFPEWKFYFILFILLSFHCTKYIYYMYNEASLQQVHTQQGKLPKTIVSYID